MLRSLEVCEALLPNGKRRFGEYIAGDISGSSGKSLSVNLRTGVWMDFATGEKGSNLLELIHQCKFPDSLADAIEYANEMLGQQTIPRAARMAEIKPATKKTIGLADLRVGTPAEHYMLAKRIPMTTESVAVAEREGVLRFFDCPRNGACYSLTDASKRVRQDRRLDGEPFVLRDGACTKSRTIGDPSHALGLPTPKPVIALCEGSSDLLAAYHLAWCESMEHLIAPVAMLGAGMKIDPRDVPLFAGKRIIMFPDNDDAGKKAEQNWRAQLVDYKKDIIVFYFGGLYQMNGQKIKDLRDFLNISPDQFSENFFSAILENKHPRLRGESHTSKNNSIYTNGN